ncbi:hypothetical protein ACWDA7_27760 [Streptomyces sp. NPDC001156]
MTDDTEPSPDWTTTYAWVTGHLRDGEWITPSERPAGGWTSQTRRPHIDGADVPRQLVLHFSVKPFYLRHSGGTSTARRGS